jgi:hypothetical protein
MTYGQYFHLGWAIWLEGRIDIFRVFVFGLPAAVMKIVESRDCDCAMANSSCCRYYALRPVWSPSSLRTEIE